MSNAERGAFVLFLTAMITLSGCGGSRSDPAAEAPPPAQVEHVEDANVIHVDHPGEVLAERSDRVQLEVAVGGHRGCRSRYFQERPGH